MSRKGRTRPYKLVYRYERGWVSTSVGDNIVWSLTGPPATGTIACAYEDQARLNAERMFRSSHADEAGLVIEIFYQAPDKSRTSVVRWTSRAEAGVQEPDHEH